MGCVEGEDSDQGFHMYEPILTIFCELKESLHDKCNVCCAALSFPSTWMTEQPYFMDRYSSQSINDINAINKL